MKYVVIPEDVVPLDVEGKAAFMMIGAEGEEKKKRKLDPYNFLDWLGDFVLNDPKLSKTGSQIKMGRNIEIKIKECREDGDTFLALSEDELEMMMVAVDDPSGGYSNARIQYGEGGSVVAGAGRQMASFITAMDDASDKKPSVSKSNKKAARKKTARTKRVSGKKANGIAAQRN